jgi:hypothetical protein
VRDSRLGRSRQRSSGRGTTPIRALSRQHAQHQIIVLGPTAVAVPERAQRRRANEQRGVGDGALEQRRSPARPPRSHRVEEGLVGEAPGPEVRPREQPERARRPRRAPGWPPARPPAPRAVRCHEVVGVHARDRLAAAALQAGGERAHDPRGAGRSPVGTVDRAARRPAPRRRSRPGFRHHDHDALPVTTVCLATLSSARASTPAAS